jgi:hypothetical protein
MNVLIRFVIAFCDLPLGKSALLNCNPVLSAGCKD